MMRCLTAGFVPVLACVVACSLNAQHSTPTDFQIVVHRFDYDAKQPLNIHDKVIEEAGEAAIHDITYASPGGGVVSAYLVVPNGKGPYAAVLFGHWGAGTRTEYIPEAKVYAKAGAISLLPDYLGIVRLLGERALIISTSRR